MIVDRISYKKIFPIGSYLTEHIGLEASLDDKENPEEALNKLKVMVDTLHAETLTHLEEFRGTTVRDIKEEKVPDKIQGWKEVIGQCTSEKALGMFKTRVEEENNPELTEAFNKKLLEFQKNS